MRQRNDTGHVQDVSAWPTKEHPDLRPFTVGPGEEIDHPTLIGGFTSLEPEPAPDPDPDGAEEAESGTAAEAAQPAAKTTRKSPKTTTAPTSTEGGESQ